MIGTRVMLSATDTGTVLAVRGTSATVLRDDGLQVTLRLDALSKVIPRVDDEICAGISRQLSEYAYGRRLFSGELADSLMKKAAKDLAHLYRKSNDVKDLGVLLARETSFFKPNPEDAELAGRYGRKLAQVALGIPYDGLSAELVVPTFQMTQAPESVTWRGIKPIRLQTRTRRPPRPRKR